MIAIAGAVASAHSHALTVAGAVHSVGRCRSARPGTPSAASARPTPTGSRCAGATCTGDLMGRVSFTEYFHLLLTGREPTEEQRFFLDLLLVAIAEHGMMPTNVAARMTLAADPGLAAGRGRRRHPRLRAGDPRHGGGVRAAARAGAGAGARAARAPDVGRRRDRDRDPRRRRQGARLRPSRAPAARPARRADPRARRRARRQRPARRARARASATPCTRRGEAAADERLDADRGGAARPRLPGGDASKAIPLLARTASLLAHLAEEQQSPSASCMAAARRGGDRVPAGRPRRR